MTSLSIRLYVEDDLYKGSFVSLDHAKSHYLMHVMRCTLGDQVRLFHQGKGEWQATLVQGVKKQIQLKVDHLLRAYVPTHPSCHLACPPLRQNRLDMLIEQACALGMTRFTPLVTDHTQVRHVSHGRLHKIAIECAEQSERMDLPVIDDIQPLHSFLQTHQNTTVYVALERHDAALPLWQAVQTSEQAIWMTGPEGGWSVQERESFLALPYVCPVNLGAAILRSETAALKALSLWSSWHQYHASTCT